MTLDPRTERRPYAGALAGIDARPCAACGSVGYPGDRYCACCGAQLMRLCRGCGAPVLQPVANYCTRCGRALATRDDAAREPATPERAVTPERPAPSGVAEAHDSAGAPVEADSVARRTVRV